VEVRAVAVAIFVILTLVLLLLFLTALALLRTPKAKRRRGKEQKNRSESAQSATGEGSVPGAPREDETVSAAERLFAHVRASPKGGLTDEGVTGHLAVPDTDGKNRASDYQHATPECVPSGGSQLFLVDRPATAKRASYIRLVAGLNGNRLARDELVEEVVKTLGPLGFSSVIESAGNSRLETPDGRTAAIITTELDSGDDRIEIVVDATLAGDALTALRRWHRTDLDSSDRVQISALIR
jgi:hypothetical protein